MVPKPKNPLFILILLTNWMPFRCPISPCWKHTLFSSSPAETEYKILRETHCQNHQKITVRMRNFLHTDVAVSVINETRSSPPDGDANFDGNMVIILAALLCALICALGLNSFVRCVFQCRRGLSGEEGLIGSKGVAKDALGKIPVVVYGAGTDIPATGTDCSICLGEFKEGEKVRVLPRCGHGFHVKCIDAWLAKHSSCPNCRQLLYGLPAGVQSGRSS